MLVTLCQYNWRWRRPLMALVAGLILPLSFAPFHYYPVAVISLALLFQSWQAISAKQAAFCGFLFGLGMFGVGVSWVYVAIHDFGNASPALALGLTGLFVAFLASYLALLGWLINKLTIHTISSVDYLVLLPIAWLAFEWFKGWFLTGFPWLDVGVGQIDGPLSGYTPIIGAIGVSFLVAFSAGLVVVAFQSRKAWPLLVFLTVWLGGYALKPIVWTLPQGKPLNVSLIQGNIPQQIKWDPDQLFKTLALYQTRTQQNWQSDLIVWPENAVTVFYHQAKSFYLEPLAEQARLNNTDILLGLPVMDDDSGGYFNSMMSLGSQQHFYHKRHLVPFGDYVPLEWLRGLIAFFDLPMSRFEPGPKQQPLTRIAGHNVGISICYEDAFSNEVLDTVPEATLLVNATNNAWYGDSFAPHQHLQISRNRALETGRPIVRSTTNGISAIINFDGTITAKTEQFIEAVLTATIQPRQGVTPYVAWGRPALWLLSLFMLIVWAYYRFIVSDKKNSCSF